MRRALLLGSVLFLGCGSGKGVAGVDSADTGAGSKAGPMDLTGPIALPKAIPADARLVVAARAGKPLLDTLMTLDLSGTRDLAEAQATVKEIDDFVNTKLGIRVAGIRGFSGFVLGEGGAVVVEGVSGTPTGEPRGDHQGTPLFQFEAQAWLAIVDDLLIVGTRDAVEGGIEAATGKSATFAAASHERSKAWARITDGAYVGAVMSAELLEKERDFRPAIEAGVEAGVVAIGPAGWSATVFGPPDKMGILADQARGALALGVTAAEGAKSEALAGDDVLIGVGAILGVQSARDVQRALKIETKDRELTVSMPIVASMDNAALIVPVVGILAAIAIPSFTKYMRRAKTAEAKAQLARLFDATSAYFQEEHVGYEAVLGDPNAPPASAPHRCPSYEGKASGATPLTPPRTVDCSAGPGGRCTPGGSSGSVGGYPASLWTDDRVWDGLNFRMEQGHHFHYRFRYSNATTGYGACQFTVQAFGDLDGDGVFSTFERSGAADINGVNAAAGLFIDNEVE